MAGDNTDWEVAPLGEELPVDDNDTIVTVLPLASCWVTTNCVPDTALSKVDADDDVATSVANTDNNVDDEGAVDDDDEAMVNLMVTLPSLKVTESMVIRARMASAVADTAVDEATAVEMAVTTVLFHVAMLSDGVAVNTKVP